METNFLRRIISLAENDLKKFEARHSGYEKNDKHIEEAQTIIKGAKKLLDELEKHK